MGLISTVVWITFTWCCNKLCIYAVCKTALPKMSAIYSNSRQEQYITQIIKHDMCTCLCSLCQGSHGCPHKTTTLWNKFFIRIFKSELRIESSFLFFKKVHLDELYWRSKEDRAFTSLEYSNQGFFLNRILFRKGAFKNNLCLHSK